MDGFHHENGRDHSNTSSGDQQRGKKKITSGEQCGMSEMQERVMLDDKFETQTDSLTLASPSSNTLPWLMGKEEPKSGRALVDRRWLLK